MEEISLKIFDLLANEEDLIFLIGAGCSIDAPSCLPDGTTMIKEIIKFTCAETEIEEILEIEDLRFETLAEIIRNHLDFELNILNFFELCKKPNIKHFFLADMIKKGSIILTTNLDFLIEHALLQLYEAQENILPIITPEDYVNFTKSFDLIKNNSLYFFKLHGSTKNIITNDNIKDYLITLLKIIGSQKGEIDLFNHEKFKRDLFYKLFEQKTLVIMGYSGYNDYDIIPSLKNIKNIKNIIWLNHIENDNGKEKVFEISDKKQVSGIPDKLNQILIELKRMNNNIKIYRVNINTRRCIKNLMDFEPILDTKHFSIEFSKWLRENIKNPSDLIKTIIPHIIYFNFDRIDDSLRCGVKALKILNDSKEYALKDLILNNIGWIHFQRGNYSEAILKYEQLVNMAKDQGDWNQQVIYLNNIGEIYERSKDYQEALKRYREAIVIAKKIDNTEEKIRAFDSIIEIYENLDDFMELLDLYQEAISIAEKNKDDQKIMIYFNNMATIYFKQELFHMAIEHFEKSEEVARNINDLEKLTIILNNLGSLYEKFNDYTNALKKFNEALKIDEVLRNNIGKARRLNKIGGVYIDLEEYSEALQKFKEAFSIADALEDSSLKMELINKIGKTFFFKKEYVEALRYFNNGLKIAQKLDNLKMEADFLNNIAGCHYMNLEYRESLNYTIKSLQTMKLLGLGKSIKVVALKKKIRTLQNQLKL